MKIEALVKDGKFNRKAIMQKAWAYVKNPFSTEYRKDFKGALKAAWADAHLAMDAYNASLVAVESKPAEKRGNVLKLAFLAGNPEYRFYDSSWR